MEVWRHFAAISSIPRCSGNEEGILRYVENLAHSHDCESSRDETGNLLVRKAGRGSGVNAPGVCIQAHVDMVCEKNGNVVHDFSADPVKLFRENDFLRADGTTLGADNGIGAASMMALIECDFDHPPLELLFTIDEERGLTGAQNLRKNWIESGRLINTDTEEWGAFFIGCSGGGDLELRLPLTVSDSNLNHGALALTLRGLQGGHSGVDIHRGRGNAVTGLARLLGEAILQGFPLSLSELMGGEKRNAIPREAHAVVQWNENDVSPDVLERTFRRSFEQYQDEFSVSEPTMELMLEPASPGASFSPADSKRLISLLQSLPVGPLSMNPHIPDLVESSCNPASVRLDGQEAIIGLSVRASTRPAIVAILDRITLIGEMSGAIVTRGGVYPGWKPDPDSSLLKNAIHVYENLFGEKPNIKAVHAGLETGVIGDRYANLDMISIGPEINFPHSPAERVQISSVESYWNLLIALLKNLSTNVDV